MKHVFREDSVTSDSLFRLYQDLFFEQDFPGVRMPIRNAKDIGLLSKMLKEMDEKEAWEYIVGVFEHWDMLKKRCRITGHPTVGVLWGFRMSFLGLLNEPRANSVEYKAKKSATVSTGKLFLAR